MDAVTSIRHIEVEGYNLTISRRASFNGEEVDGVVDPDARSVVISGATTDERIACAFAAGLHMHEGGGPVDDNVTSLPPRARICPLLEGDGQPHVEEPWQSS